MLNSTSDSCWASFLDSVNDIFALCSVPEKIAVGVSGGSDSCALLHLLWRWAKQHSIRLYCVTVNHQLRDDSAEEANFVSKLCYRLNVPHIVLTWEHEDYSVGKIENAAREARYRLLEAFCKQHDIKYLCVGHTWNDQLETFEMRNDKGSASFGLACMSRIRSLSKNVQLIRPVLRCTRDQLQNYLLQENSIPSANRSWCNDSMNDNDIFLRVQKRHYLQKLSENELAVKSKTIIQAGEQRRAIEMQAVQFLKTVTFSPYGFARFKIDIFNKEPINVQQEIIRRIIWNIGGKKYPTPVSCIMINQILHGTTCTLGRCVIRKRRSDIFVCRENRNIPILSVNDFASRPLIWDNRFLITANSYLLNKSSVNKERKHLSKAVLQTLPCVTDEHGIKCPIDGFLFAEKTGLFDVFL